MKVILSFLVGVLVLSSNAFSQKQLIVLKRGSVVAHFTEGQYFKCVLRKSHRHTEGHILELSDFSMITSSDTIKFQDIEKIDMRKQRASIGWSSGVGGFMFLGGLLYLGIDQLNAAIGIHSSDLTPAQLYPPVIISAVGAALVFIRPRYKHVGLGYYFRTVDYTSPFYQR